MASAPQPVTADAPPADPGAAPAVAQAPLQTAAPRAAAAAATGADGGGAVGPFRAELTGEIYAMARHLMGGGLKETFSEATAAALGALDRGERPEMERLLAAHADLKAQIAPATPRALLAKDDRVAQTGVRRLLGPNPIVRHLAIANMFFLLLFFGVSLSPEINLTTLNQSIYEQSGMPLFIKLVFLVAAAGLGASFGALFDVWDELKADRFDPRGESVHWMKVGLGIVAGLALTEIFQASASTEGEGRTSASDALLALVGGFSAGLLHIALSRTVNAVKSIFAPPGKD